jgi:pyridoxal phosphate enzyme (YggS family)
LSIRENIDDIVKKIEAACKKVGRNPNDITLIAVSKTVESPKVREAVAAGVDNLGENRVQELVKKYEDLKDIDIKWHMIGHLQKNKVKYIIDKTVLIHSVESLSLAEEIDKRAKKAGIVANVLIELNIGEEESKFGIKEENVYDFVKSMEEFENIKVSGLMTVAPFCENPEDVRWVFKKMKDIYGFMKSVSAVM